MLSLVDTQNVHTILLNMKNKLENIHVNGREPVCALGLKMQIDLISNIGQPPMYSICKLLSLSLFTCLAHSKEVHYKIIHLIRKNFTVISRYLNKIFVAFPIPISGHDYSLFHIFRQ